MRSRTTLATIEAAAIEGDARVALDDRLDVARQVGRVVAVDEGDVGHAGQGGEGAAHGPERGLADVDACRSPHARSWRCRPGAWRGSPRTAPRARRGSAPSNSASPCGTLSRSSTTAAATTGPGERPAPDLVDAGDGAAAAAPQWRSCRTVSLGLIMGGVPDSQSRQQTTPALVSCANMVHHGRPGTRCRGTRIATVRAARLSGRRDQNKRELRRVRLRRREQVGAQRDAAAC